MPQVLWYAKTVAISFVVLKELACNVLHFCSQSFFEGVIFGFELVPNSEEVFRPARADRSLLLIFIAVPRYELGANDSDLLLHERILHGVNAVGLGTVLCQSTTRFDSEVEKSRVDFVRPVRIDYALARKLPLGTH